MTIFDCPLTPAGKMSFSFGSAANATAHVPGAIE
jgi:hypothetical protein